MDSKAPKKFRVLIEDDSPVMVRTISRCVSGSFEVIGSASNGKAALQAVMELLPDVVVLDILMPVLDGIQVTRRLTAMRTTSRIVVLTGLENPEYVKAALEGGAHAFVFKRRMASDLLQAINDAIDGRLFLSESVNAVYLQTAQKVS